MAFYDFRSVIILERRKKAAIAIDAAIDTLDSDFLARIETEGKPFRLNRASHREHHLEQIEKARA
jgi:predicted nuclease of predicted toxin-antitoxin system